MRKKYVILEKGSKTIHLLISWTLIQEWKWVASQDLTVANERSLSVSKRPHKNLYPCR